MSGYIKDIIWKKNIFDKNNLKMASIYQEKLQVNTHLFCKNSTVPFYMLYKYQ